MRTSAAIAIVTLLTPLAPAAAQNTIQGLENFTLARPQPTPTPTPSPSPPPVATPTPAPTPTVTAPTASPSATATPRVPTATSRPTPVPTRTPRAATPEPSPSATATLAAPAEPAVTPTEAAPTPPPTEPVVGDAAPAEGEANWPLWLAIAVAGLAAIGAILWFRRRGAGEEAADAYEAEPVPAVAPVDVPAPVETPVTTEAADPVPVRATVPGGLVTSALRPAIEFRLFPLRAGVDTLRATLEYGLQVINSGRAVAHDVTVEGWLLSASHETAADLTRALASPVSAPMVPPFDLPATAGMDLTGVATAPREALAVISAGERRLYVPILALRASYRDGRGAAQVATAAFLVGSERSGQDRLAPLPLDRGSRMNEGLAARIYNQ